MGLPRKGPLSAAACFGWVTRGHAFPREPRSAVTCGEMSDASFFAHWLRVCDLRRQPLAFYVELVAFLKSQDVLHWKHLADVDADFSRPQLSPRSSDVITRRRARGPLVAARCGCAQGHQRGEDTEGHAGARGFLFRSVQTLQRNRSSATHAPPGRRGRGG